MGGGLPPEGSQGGGTYRTTFWVEILARNFKNVLAVVSVRAKGGGTCKATTGYTYAPNCRNISRNLTFKFFNRKFLPVEQQIFPIEHW